MQLKNVTSPTKVTSQPVTKKIEIRQIRLVGRNVFQNRFLKTALESQLEPRCQVEIVQVWQPGNDSMISDLILWDGYELEASEIWFKLSLNAASYLSDYKVALFNIEADAGISFERQAIKRSIKGIFYLNEPPDRFLKGVEKILQGELWFSRKTTSKILIDTLSKQDTIVVAKTMLTGREKEILNAIASGASNGEIAESFFISLNTVKSHLSNIYKKIDVKNRFEATLWVARYM